MLRSIRAFLIAAGVCICASVVSMPAYAAPTATNSYYISSHWFNDYNPYGANGHSIWYNFGYYFDNVAGATIISFGIPCVTNGEYGLDTWEYGCLGNTVINSDLHSIQAGYDANTTHTNTMIFAVGTNSSATWPGASYVDAGYSMSLMLSQIPNTSHTEVFGAIDAEDDTGWTASRTIAIPYAHGFDVNFPSTPRTIPFYDYGYLHEASWNVTTNTPSFPTYTANDHNLLAWVYRADYPFLQQYNSTWAPWITHMALFSENNVTTDPYGVEASAVYGAWQVTGVLAGEGYEPMVQAWQDVLNAMNTSGLVQSTIDFLSWQRTLN